MKNRKPGALRKADEGGHVGKADRSSTGTFFCEKCGAQVPAAVSACPRCGSVFAGVRCPACGRRGPEQDFIRGCPSCGYQGTGPVPSAPGLEAGAPQKKNSAAGARPLPAWFFPAALIFLAAFLIFSFVVLVKKGI